MFRYITAFSLHRYCVFSPYNGLDMSFLVINVLFQLLQYVSLKYCVKSWWNTATYALAR
jgi:hypothetical protein